MHVLVDGTGLGGGSADRGLGTYLRHLLDGLAREPGMAVSVLMPAAAAAIPGVNAIPVRRVDHHRVGPSLHDLMLPREIRAAGADVAHSPAFTPPRKASLPWVQTLLDLTPLAFPHPFMARDAARWRHRGDRVRRAAVVIAISHSSKRQAVELLGVDPQRVHVVHLGVDPAFSPGPKPDAPPYLLFVSSWGPHKGLQECVAVHEEIARRGFPQRLRIVGRNDAWMRSHIDAAVASSSYRDRIDVVGWVPDLVAEYRGADALLVTSRAEGFGLPAAEALACGTPVLAFDNTSLPEVMGADSELLVPDGDVGAMSSALADLLRDPDLRASEHERGIAHVAQFTWERCINGHVEAYRRALRE